MSSRLRIPLTLVVSLVGVAALTTSHAVAGNQLVHMTNGKTLRAESVEPEGDWLVVTVPGGNVVGILASTVRRVEADLAPEPEGLGSGLNVVTSGRYIPRGRRSTSRTSRRVTSARRQAAEEAAAKAKEEKKKETPPKPALPKSGLQFPARQNAPVTPPRSNSRQRGRDR